MSMDMEEQYDKIYRYCYFRLQNRQTAEDITQETFLRYFEAHSSMKFENKSSSSLSAAVSQVESYDMRGHKNETALKYLYTIARNLCIDEYRKHPRESQKTERMQDKFLQESQGISKENGFLEEAVVTSLAVSSALSQLEKEEQELLLLRYVNEVPVSAIAKAFHISRFAAYRRIGAALKKFKEKLGKEGFD